MHNNIEKLNSVGFALSKKMENISLDFRLGFGSYVDKTVSPYISIHPGRIHNQCRYVVFIYLLYHWEISLHKYALCIFIFKALQNLSFCFITPWFSSKVHKKMLKIIIQWLLLKYLVSDFRKTVSVSEKMCCIFFSKTSRTTCCFGTFEYVLHLIL